MENSLETQIEMHKNNAIYWEQVAEDRRLHIILIEDRLAEARVIIKKLEQKQSHTEFGPDLDSDAAAVLNP